MLFEVMVAIISVASISGLRFTLFDYVSDSPLLNTLPLAYIAEAHLQQESTPAIPEIQSDLELLHSVNQQDQATALLRLKALAQTADDNRRRIVRSLIELLNDPDSAFDTRRACMSLLGDLKATEAIEALIKHLTDLHGVTGLSEHWYPAVEALHKIGPPAVPALSRALADADARTRKYAAEALILIGGKAAQERLEQALKSEQDKEVISTIESGLRYLQNSARQQRRSANK